MDDKNAASGSTPVPIKKSRRRKDGKKSSSHGPSPQGSPSLGSFGPSSSLPTQHEKQQRKPKFAEHMDRSQLQRGLKTGQVCSGMFRVNPHDKTEAYVTVEGMPSDVLIQGAAQNRAFEGDQVALVLNPISEWQSMKRNTRRGQPSGSQTSRQNSGLTPSSSMSSSASQHSAPQSPSVPAANPLTFLNMIQQRFQNLDTGSPSTSTQPPPPDPDSPWTSASRPEAALEAICSAVRSRSDMRPTARVVAILNPSDRRENVIGVLVAPQEGTIYLNPVDPRLPRMIVSSKELSEEMRQEALQPGVSNRTLVSARVVEWGGDYSYPLVSVRQSIGQAGEIQSETAALLMAEQVRTQEFSAEVEACLPQLPWSITEEELSVRRDFRSTRIFSIDPPTARDLDDALSVEPLPNGSFRVGVHIADVAHFVRPGTALDQEAALRSTSTYLVDRVIPMLPRTLCENLCSLNPGVERLAFSISFEVSDDGCVKDVWAGRSVICSCAKLAYLHAQKMIDGEFEPEVEGVQLTGGYSWDQVQADVRALHRIATSLRSARFQAGALKLDNLKLMFKMGPDGNPVEAEPYGQMDSHWLVEELMLLANRTAAQITSDAFPKLAVLRNHPPPNMQKLEEVAAMAKSVGVLLQTSSAGALQASLEGLRASCPDPTLAAMVQNLATKSMQLAKYFCTGAVDDPMAWRHYALAMDHYTHFTSPIRRYPDILVHRLLAAALELPRIPSHPSSPLPCFNGDPATLAAVAAAHGLRPAEDAHAIAEHANKRKLAARNVQDGSIRLFLAVLLRSAPVVTEGVMLQPGGDRFVQVFLPEYGCELRIQFDQCTTPVSSYFDKDEGVLTLNPTTNPDDPFSAFIPPSKNNNHRQQQHSPDFDEAAWTASLQNLQNPSGHPPLALPCELRAFSKVPLVLGAHISSRLAGHPVDVAARLYAGATLAAAHGAAAAAARPQADLSKAFSIPWADTTID